MFRVHSTRRCCPVLIAFALGSVISLNGILSAQCDLQSLMDSSGATGDEFGVAVAFDGAHAIVGVPAAEKVVLYRFDGSGWTEAATLTSALSTVGAAFGTAVAIDGTLVAVGAPSDDEAATDAGAIVVFRFDGSVWVEESKLIAVDAEADDRLGSSLSAHGNTVVGGALSTLDPSVYSFTRSVGAWTQHQRITPMPFVDGFGAGVDFDGRRLAVTATGGTPRVDFYRRESGTWVSNGSMSGVVGDDYGAVSFSGHRVAVGAPGASGGAGAVIVHRFDGSGWIVDATVSEIDAEAFGAAVDLHGDTLLVGGPTTPNPTLVTGVAWVYRRTDIGWEKTDTLEIAPEVGAQHGGAVALFGSLALVGACGGDGVAIDSGKVTAYATTSDSSTGLVASDPSGSMWFGRSSATWGSRVLTGSPNATGAVFSTAGAVYVHRDDVGSWVEEAKLVAAVGSNLDEFGDSVDLYGDVAVVGAPLRNGNEGAVYVYRFDGVTWNQEQILIGVDALGAQHKFGGVVSAGNDVIAVGGADDSTLGTAVGSVTIFEYDDGSGTWNEVQKLSPSMIEPFSSFGESIELDGDRLVVGASGALGAAGRVYVFEFDGATWWELQVLEESPPGPTSRFGNSVSVWGGWLAIGTRFGDDAGTNSGSVSLFRFDGTSWVEHDVLVPSGLDPDDQVGTRTVVDAGVLATTSPLDDLVVPNAGSVYSYRWEGDAWLEGVRFTSRVPDESEGLGTGLSLGFGRLVAGTPFTDGPFVDTGSTTVISLLATLCDEPFVRADANLDGIVDIADVVALLDHLFAGAPSGCVDVLDVNANGSLSITDAFQLLCTIFCVGDVPIFPPYPDCGTNLYGPGVGCDAYGACP